MPLRRYGARQGSQAGGTAERVLDTADTLIREGRFHTATVEQIAGHAAVSRATVFSRFGSRLGILEALYDRCGASPESQALRQALVLDDPVQRLDAAIEAGCRSWEEWGHLHQHLRAVVALEPDVQPLVEDQHRFHHDALEAIASDLNRQKLLREPYTARQAAAALRAVTGLETFLELRRRTGLSLDQTVRTTHGLAHGLLRV